MTEAGFETAIIVPEDWTRILPLDTHLPPGRSLEVEIGCGKGRFLTARARKQPSTNFLGIERMGERIRKADRKIVRERLGNVRLLRVDAAYAVERLLPPASVSVFYVFFPDPWPKRRHHRRRLFSPDFMNAMCRTLVPAGKLYAATDHADYGEAISRLLRSDSRFREIPPMVPEADEQTEFERIFLSQGQSIGRCGFERRLS